MDNKAISKVIKEQTGFEVGNPCWAIEKNVERVPCSICSGNKRIDVTFNGEWLNVPCCFCRGSGETTEYRYELVEKVVHGIEYSENKNTSCCKIVTKGDSEDLLYMFSDYRIYDFSVNREQLFATIEDYVFADKQVAEIVLKEINDLIAKAEANDEE